MNKNVGVMENADTGVYLNLKIIANQRESNIGRIDEWRGSLRVFIAAEPVSSKANKELLRLFERIFPEAKGKIIIVKGEKSNSKRVFMPISMELAVARLELNK